MSQESRQNIDWISDLIVKVLCGACTILLGFAVSSLQNMSTEIKTLSANVFELSAQSKVLIVTLDNLERRISKIESDTEKLKEKAAQLEQP